jgi:hypothetical protein
MAERPTHPCGGYRWKTNLILRRMGDAGWLWKVI